MIEIKSYQVFLAFTNDLEEEEKIFREVLNSYSEEIRYDDYIEFRPVTWKDIPSQDLRGHHLQDHINKKLLDKSDYCVFVIHEHLGSPLGEKDDTKGIQKTSLVKEWEVVERLLRDEGKNMQDRACFFKEVDKKKLEKPDKNLKKVMEFKEKVITQVLREDYDTIDKFKTCLKNSLKNWKKNLQPIQITSSYTSLEGERSDG